METMEEPQCPCLSAEAIELEVCYEYACNDASEWKQTGARQVTQGGQNGKRQGFRREGKLIRPPKDWIKV